MQRKIDAHHHFWQVVRGDYHWMPAGGVLRNDYLPDDLKPLNSAAGIDGTILVQAAQTVAETEFLLKLAAQPGSSVLGVTGWVALGSPDAPAQLERLAESPKLVGIRPMIQDLPSADWVLQAQVIDNLRRLPDLGLRFELLTYANQLPQAYEALSQIPDLDIVINHLSKPAYRQGVDADDWRQWMGKFAELPRAYCKLSGMVTEAGSDWAADDFRAHADVILEAFGPERVMFGSDWPVCLLAASHSQVVDLANQLIAALSADEQAAVLGGSAADFYAV
jgi:L-fuconolactonase